MHPGFRSDGQDVNDCLQFQQQKVKPMSAITFPAAAILAAALPAAVDVQRKTERRTFWTERQHISEGSQLACSITGIAEPAASWRFLGPPRKAQN